MGRRRMDCRVFRGRAYRRRFRCPRCSELFFGRGLSNSPPDAPLREARRVLRRQGQLRFVEHGLSPDPGVSKWQDRLTPVWCRCAGGCHLNRKIDGLVRSAGFTYAELSTGYARGVRPMAFMYEGTVTP
jgi:hypothetical protein